MKSFNIKKFEKKFLEFSDTYQLLSNINTLLVCVSGGVDSMVLLYLLQKYQVHFQYNLHVAHFNHMSRNGGADNDEALVSTFCEKLDVPLHTDRADVSQKAKSSGVSFEMAGRQMRYDFFYKVAAKIGNAKIATAHIQSDNTETILLRLINGTGLRGLTGIQIKRDKVIRPILFANKKDLYEYAKICNIPYHDDHTNFQNDCQRNIVRNILLPVIRKELNPNIDQNLDNFSEIILEYSNYVKQESKNLFSDLLTSRSSWYVKLNMHKMKKLATAVRKEILLISFQKVDTKINNYPSYLHMKNIEDLVFHSDTGRFVEPYKNIAVLVDRENLIVLNQKKTKWKETEIKPEKIYTRDSFIFSSKFIKFEDFTGVNNSRKVEYIDADKISGKLRLRHWRKGDTFSPLGSRITKKLSDFFVDNKVARFFKDHVPLLSDGKKIVWICGMQINDYVKITKQTKKILKLEYKEI